MLKNMYDYKVVAFNCCTYNERPIAYTNTPKININLCEFREFIVY